MLIRGVNRAVNLSLLLLPLTSNVPGLGKSGGKLAWIGSPNTPIVVVPGGGVTTCFGCVLLECLTLWRCTMSDTVD